MSASMISSFAQSYTSGQLVSKLVENYAGASVESAEGMKLLLKVAKQYENAGADKTQGRLFEIIETTKFNVKAAEMGESIRAATTESLGDPHAAADILIRKGEEILKEVQAKSSNSAASLAREVSHAKYGDMDRLVNVDHADRVQELVNKRAGSNSIYRDDYKQASPHIEKELHYENISTGGTTYSEAKNAAENPEWYALKNHSLTFGEQLFNAARDGAVAGAITGGGIALVSEGIEYYQGRKTLKEAGLSVGTKTLQSAGRSAVVASLAKGIAYIGKDTILVRGNVATAVAASAVHITQLTYQFIKGEIGAEDYVLGFGENGVSTLSGIYSGVAAGMIFGPAGAAIGGIVGLLAGQQAFQALTHAQKELKLAIEERKRAEALSAHLIQLIEEKQREIERILTAEIQELQGLKSTLVQICHLPMAQMVDLAPSVIMQVASTLHVEFQYKTQAEFDQFMLDDSLNLKL